MQSGSQDQQCQDQDQQTKHKIHIAHSQIFMTVVSCKTTITSLLYSSQSALNLVKFIKIAVFITNLCKKDYNFTYAKKLLIGSPNSRDRSFETKTKTATFRSREQDRGLDDYIFENMGKMICTIIYHTLKKI